MAMFLCRLFGRTRQLSTKFCSVLINIIKVLEEYKKTYPDEDLPEFLKYVDYANGFIKLLSEIT